MMSFYLRSSAFLRHRPQKQPPVIAAGAGTSRPVVLRPPAARRRKPGERPGGRSPQPADAQRVLDSVPAPLAPGPAPAPAPAPGPARAQVAKLEAAPPPEAFAPKALKSRWTSGTSSEDGEAEAGSQRRRVRIRSLVQQEGVPATPREAPRSSSKSSPDVLPGSDRLAAAHSPLPVRVIPTSIEEIIASLQSEAQLASDQTIRELIQSVLGQNYDIKMEVGAKGGDGGSPG